jgi:hypothetical protein
MKQLNYHAYRMTVDVIIITRANEETRRLSCFEVKLWPSVSRNTLSQSRTSCYLEIGYHASAASSQQPASAHTITSRRVSCPLSLVPRRLRLVQVEFQPAETFRVLVCLTSLELKFTLTFAAQKSMLFDTRYLPIACLAWLGLTVKRGDLEKGGLRIQGQECDL